MMQSADILASGGEDYEKNIFCSSICGSTVRFYILRKPGDGDGSEMETVIDSIKETQSGQTTEETMAGTEETAEVSTQTEPTEGQSEIQGSEWVQFTTEDHEGSSDPEDKTRSYTYYYPTVTVTIPGNETVQMKIQKELDEYVDSFVEGIENGEFGTLYEDMPVYEQSYEDLTFRVIRAMIR